jgi:hypothetical protein
MQSWEAAQAAASSQQCCEPQPAQSAVRASMPPQVIPQGSAQAATWQARTPAARSSGRHGVLSQDTRHSTVLDSHCDRHPVMARHEVLVRHSSISEAQRWARQSPQAGAA